MCSSVHPVSSKWRLNHPKSPSWSHLICVFFFSREATPPPHHSSQLEAYSLQSVPESLHPSSSPHSGPLLSQLVYQRDTREKQTDKDLDSTHSSALESTDVRYLNDQPALDTLRADGQQSHLTRVPAAEGPKEESTPKAQPGMDSRELSPFLTSAPGTVRRGESTPSTSPGSASQRLENLRRHQPDDKLEKLKERIRRQRQHLEEAAEKEKLLGHLEQPITAAVGSNNAGTSSMPATKIRKVAAAPPAPIYKGNMCVPQAWFLFVLLLNQEIHFCKLVAFGSEEAYFGRKRRRQPFFHSQVSTVLRQRSRLQMERFGRRRTFIISAEKYTETCHDSLLVSIQHQSFLPIAVVSFDLPVSCISELITVW